MVFISKNQKAGHAELDNHCGVTGKVGFGKVIPGNNPDDSYTCHILIPSPYCNGKDHVNPKSDHVTSLHFCGFPVSSA